MSENTGNVIRQLPDSVANIIAAGEVVQNPASVLKELVENSIDAGATEVRVVIKDAGRTLIQVIDNGCGMNDIDARLAFERHATSKIQSASDLMQLHTMGFRGEALASIAAVAHVDLITRREQDELGIKVEIAGSKLINEEPIVAPKGSQFCVKDLFFNTPARRNFLKKDSTELKNLETEFIRIALAHPDVALTFVHNSQTLYDLKAANLRVRVSAVAGKAMSKYLLPIECDNEIVKLSGFVGTTESARKTAGNQYFIVNNRFMKSSYFHKAIIEAYRNIIPNDQSPAYYVYMDVDPQTIDVNVHPQKTEIKFENDSEVWRILNATVKECLGKNNIMPTIDFEVDSNIALNIPAKGEYNMDQIADLLSLDPSRRIDIYNPFDNESDSKYKSVPFTYDRGEGCTAPVQTYTSKLGQGSSYTGGGSYSSSYSHIPQPSTRGWETLYEGLEKQREEPVQQTLDINVSTIESGLNSTILPSERFYQYKGRYIVVQVQDGLMLIDQRRAHERIQYDTISGMISSGHAASQPLMFPEYIAIGAEDACIVEELSSELSRVGLEVEYLAEEGNLKITAIPAIFEVDQARSFIEQLIYDCQNGEIDIQAGIQEYVCTAVAAQSAMPYGKMLTNEEMSSLYDRLFSSASPAMTPRGKRIFALLDDNTLNSMFA
ncbi:MAG: DNA mismatch repair endonuclease MutL [Bacteroidia bacterium]|nr:DNA mismatch repair endonuclease MutL [Bacteroidia bacterium]